MHTSYFCLAALFGALAFAPVQAERNVFLEASFESGRIQASGSKVDSFYIMTLPNPQLSGTCSYYSPEGQGGFDASSKTDLRVIKSEIWKEENIQPRSGTFFVRNVIDRSKCYPNNAPRGHMVLTTPGQEYLWDEEIWVGFSVFLPKTWEHDNKYKRADMAHLSGIGIFSSNASAGSSHMDLRVQASPTSEYNEWALRLVPTDATTINDESNAFYSLTSIAPDLGKWTDFVFRIRFNPFSDATNPAQAGIAGARDQWYEGNRGILQIWKSSGEPDINGNRPLEMIFSRVNEPLGLVPRADRGLRLIFDIYKYSWQTFDTDPVGPIFVGYDEIRYGRAAQEGTSFVDVAPPGANLDDAAPEPPAVSVN